MIVIFHKPRPIGKLLVKRDTKVISIKRNGVQLYEEDDYSLREIENEKELTIVQDFGGNENEIATLIDIGKENRKSKPPEVV